MDILLAVRIIESFYGPYCSSLINYLLENGGKTLDQIYEARIGLKANADFEAKSVESNAFSYTTIKYTLSLLYKHSVVSTYQSRNGILYEASIKHILFHVLFPKVLKWTSKNRGRLVFLIVSEILVAGFISKNSLLLKLQNSPDFDQASSSIESTPGDEEFSFSTKEYFSAFEKLLSEKLITEVKSYQENYLNAEEPRDEDYVPLKRKAAHCKAKQRKKKKLTKSALQTNEKPVELKRMLEERIGQKLQKKTQSSKIEESSNVSYEGEGTSIIVKLNITFILEEIRADMLNDYLVQKIGSPEIVGWASLALKESTAPIRLDLRDDFLLTPKSDWLSVDQLLQHSKEKLSQNFQGEEQAALNIFIENLSSLPQNVLETEGKGVDLTAVQFNFENIVSDIRENVVWSIVKDQLGIESLRILKLIKANGAVEEKKIGELALMPPKTARKHLYRLFQKGYVKWQEAPKRSDYDPRQTFHLWTIDMEAIYEKLAVYCYGTYSRLWTVLETLEEKNFDLNRYKKFEGKDPEEVPGMWRYLKFLKAKKEVHVARLMLAETILILDFL